MTTQATTQPGTETDPSVIAAAAGETDPESGADQQPQSGESAAGKPPDA